MFKALYIRYKLSSSIPWEFRPYYSLIADPAAGTFTVVYRIPRLGHPGFYRLRSSNQPEHETTGWKMKQWRHFTFYLLVDVYHLTTGALKVCLYRLFHSKSTAGARARVSKASALERGHISNSIVSESKAKASFISLPVPSACGPVATTGMAGQSLNEAAQDPITMNETSVVARPSTMLHSPWKTTALRCGFYHYPSSTWETPKEVRFAVDIDFRIEPTPLLLDWRQFVWTALAFGVDEYAWHSKQQSMETREGLYSHNGDKIFSITDYKDGWLAKLEPSVHGFSLCRALAADNIVVAGSGKSPQSRSLATPGLTYDLASLSHVLCDTGPSAAVPDKARLCGLSLKHAPQPLEAAICLGLHNQRSTPAYPANEELLEYHERSLCELKKVFNHKRCESLLEALKACSVSGDLAERVIAQLRCRKDCRGS